ncbi:DUF3261 domain-containing protein [Candidatus Rariloculus sp.]|uniref:DUF3261 domain-containing protein n=1 Tax=Candidatus Rariloculus sp. TaxID=3101265 RepID=UPI003D10DD7E
MQDILDATQLITATYDDRDYTMQAQLEWRPGSMALAGLSPWGTVVFSIAYDGSEMEIRGNGALLQGLRGEYVLADILLTFWERPRLIGRLRGEGLAVSDVPGKRTITRNGSPLIVIDYENEIPWNGRVRFEHRERGYVLQIQTVGYSAP